jgi:hypothetical protein
MKLLSEDPTILTVVLAAVGVFYLVVLRATQEGKYLVFAGTAFCLAAMVVAVERSWVTDNERIAQVVDDLRSAAARSDVAGVLAHLTPDVQYGRDNDLHSPEETRSMIESRLSHAVFDIVRVSRLRTNAGSQSRRGTAEFRVFAKGRLDSSIGTITIGTADSEWALSFREVEPHVWKVSQITPVSVPGGVMPGGQPGPRPPNRHGGPARGGRPGR